MADEFEINLVCCTHVICNEIARGVRQKDIALSYALAIKSEAQQADAPDWKTINDAIVARWGKRGMTRVKNAAWRHLKSPRPA